METPAAWICWALNAAGVEVRRSKWKQCVSASVVTGHWLREETSHTIKVFRSSRTAVATHFKPRHCSFLTPLAAQPIFHCDWLTNASSAVFHLLFGCSATMWVTGEKTLQTETADIFSQKINWCHFAALPGRDMTQLMVKAFTSTSFCPQGEECV